MLCTVFLSIVLGVLHLSGERHVILKHFVTFFIGASAQCRITKHPKSQNVSLGATVDLQCLIDLERDVVVTPVVTYWLFGEERVDRGKYEFKEDGTLTINSFDSSYAGLYRCVVDNGAELRLCVSRAATLLYYNG